LGETNAEKEETLESLRLQLCRAEADCSVLESQLETLDTENRRLSQVANNAELQLRLGAEIRQDALEGMGEELANVKNTAVEALAERDSLRARLREQNNTNSDSEVCFFDAALLIEYLFILLFRHWSLAKLRFKPSELHRVNSARTSSACRRQQDQWLWSSSKLCPKLKEPPKMQQG